MRTIRQLPGTTPLLIAACLIGGLALAGCDQAGQEGNDEPMVNPDEQGESPGGAGAGQEGGDQEGTGMDQEEGGGGMGE
ncbi:MAG: hypothetical protein ACLFRB_04190 [Thiohalorhabdus sp.]|uniref:hypothetical protein n=1 Tax=Thiohalorhabdus sp. TaxID=3094134 RepID=UPI00397F691A